MLSPVLIEIDDEFGDEITIAKVNVDLNQKTARSYQVMSIPTLKFFKHGKEVGTFTGFKSKVQLNNLVRTILKP
ncbi:Thioredoxin [compost metagenome]